MTKHAAFALALNVGLCAGLAGLARPASLQPASNVKVGYCTTLKNLDAAKAAGFEYAELSATEIANLPEPEFEAAAAHVRQLGIPTPTANLFLPAVLKVLFYR